MKTFAYMPEVEEESPLPEGGDVQKGGRKKKTQGGGETPKPRMSGPTFTLTLLLIVFLVSMIARLGGETNPLGWLFGSNGGGGGSLPEDIGVALAPILALALAIERLIETVFDFFETNLKEMAKKTTGAADSLNYIDQMCVLYTKQMNQAKDALQEAIDGNKPQKEKDKLAAAVKKAEDLVLEAGNRLELLPKDPKYLSWKRALSILLGLAMGMVVAVFTDKGVFYYLDINVPRILDMLLTGFILGAGSGPLHSLIGILQGAKDAVAGLANPSAKGLGDLTRQVQSLSDQMAANKTP
jgi:hypothetical protein